MELVSYQLLNAVPTKVELLWYFGTGYNYPWRRESWFLLMTNSLSAEDLEVKTN